MAKTSRQAKSSGSRLYSFYRHHFLMNGFRRFLSSKRTFPLIL
nr:MAG TPA: hypothetical protein [Caudoviricetes sp.]